MHLMMHNVSASTGIWAKLGDRNLTPLTPLNLLQTFRRQPPLHRRQPQARGRFATSKEGSQEVLRRRSAACSERKDATVLCHGRGLVCHLRPWGLGTCSCSLRGCGAFRHGFKDLDLESGVASRGAVYAVLGFEECMGGEGAKYVPFLSANAGECSSTHGHSMLHDHLAAVAVVMACYFLTSHLYQCGKHWYVWSAIVSMPSGQKEALLSQGCSSRVHAALCCDGAEACN